MRHKISYKLIFLILLISFIITSISIYFQIEKQYKNEISSLEVSLNNIKNNQIPILSQSLWNIDNVAIDIFLNNLVKDEKIIYAEVIEDNGERTSIGEEKEIEIIRKEFEVEKTIGSKVHKLGRLIVIADLKPMYEELKNDVISIVFVEFIKMFLISLSIIFFMKKLLTDPLEKMADYANQLSLENLNKPLVINEHKKESFDELNIVTESINTMRINLINEIQKSEEKNNLLAQQSKLAAMGEMVGNIAHQWRQPLSMITTTLSGIKLNHEQGILDKKSLDNYIDKIISSTKYLSETIDDFRYFFKPNRDKEYFRISTALDRTFNIINSQFANKNINLIKNIEDIEVFGFENELIQVFINILNNARDALITKENQKLFIFIDVFLKDDNVHICIRDNAGGIDENIINRIFEPYFTTKHQSQGTGIGLYMSEEIIAKHMNGELNVQNIDFIYEEISYKGVKFEIIIAQGEKN